MSLIKLQGNASGTGAFTIAAPNGNTDRTLTLPDATGTVNVSGLANEVPAGSAGAPAIYPTGDSNTGIFFPAADTIAFAEGGSEAMRIDSSGNLLVGTTTATGKLTLNGVGGSVNQSLYATGWGSGVGAFATLKAVSTANADVMYFETSAALVGKIAITSTATTYATSSDYRLKEDWQPMTGASERVLALKPVNFAWKADGSRVDGFLAHEAQEVVPEAVTGTKDEVDDEGNPKYQGIDQSKLVPLLTAALQEALAELANLKTRLTALEAN